MTFKSAASFGLFALAVALLVWSNQTSLAQSAYEEPPVLEASKILSPELLEGPDFLVSERVASDGYWNIYQVRSNFGDFVAGGSFLLERRVREIAAIGELKRINEAQVVGEAAADSLVEVGKSLEALATQPKETAEGMGNGVKRLFGRVGRGARRTGERVDDTVRGGESGGEGSDRSKVEKVGAAGAAVGKWALGISSAQRRWAKKLGVDPYTENQVLRAELTRVASFDAGGRIATTIVVPIPIVLSVTAGVSDLVWEKDPEELVTLNKNRLNEMGVEGQVSRDFRLSSHYPLSFQTVLVGSLYESGDVSGRANFIARAATVQSEDEAAFFVLSAVLLERFHREEANLREIVPDLAGAAALTDDNRPVHLAPVDYVVWSQDLADYIANTAPRLEREYPNARHEVWFTGRASDRTKKEFGALGWIVFENALE